MHYPPAPIVFEEEVLLLCRSQTDFLKSFSTLTHVILWPTALSPMSESACIAVVRDVAYLT